MVGSSKDVLIIGGILGIVYIAYRGIGGFMKGLNPLSGLPTINISNPLNLSNPVNTTYPNAPSHDADFLKSIEGGFASQNKTLEDYLKSLNENLTKLGTPANPANAPTSPTPIDVILNDPTLTQEQKNRALEILNPSVPSDLSKFNPKGIFGYGFLGENKKGIPLDLAQNLNLVGKFSNQITAQQLKLLSNIDINENLNVVMQDKSGVGNLMDFFNSFGVPYQPDFTDVHKISGSGSSSSGTDASNAIVQTTETARQKNIKIPAQPTSFKVLGGTFTNSLGFVGGKTTMGDNLVDTLSEVLKIFPNLTASQARNALFQHQGLDPAHFAQINPLQKNLSSDGLEKVPNILGNTSNKMFQGMNPTDISSALMRHLA